MILNPQLRTASLLAVIATAWLMDANGATAQNIEWAQTLNLPKGVNLPKGLTADLLGIELGESYASAKPKIERLLKESSAPANGKSIDEVVREIRFNVPGGSALTARYPGYIELKMNVPGSGKSPIKEIFSVYFSAPSSGQQVVGIGRSIEYSEHADQPRIVELTGRLKEKFKSAPQVYPLGRHEQHRFVFHQGRVADPAKQGYATCNADYGIQRDIPMNSSDVPNWNRERACDVVLRLEIVYGLSNEHIGRINFMLSDNERAKQNFLADYAFFGGYVKRVQDKAKGAVPKL